MGYSPFIKFISKLYGPVVGVVLGTERHDIVPQYCTALVAKGWNIKRTVSECFHDVPAQEGIAVNNEEKKSEFRNNIVTNSLGNNKSTANSHHLIALGMYMDGSKECVLINITLAYNTTGMFLNAGSEKHVVKNNVFFGNKQSLKSWNCIYLFRRVFTEFFFIASRKMRDAFETA